MLCGDDSSFNRIFLAWRRVRYWVCSFSINQWSIEEELGGMTIESTPFYNALWSTSCNGTVMVIQETAEPLKRVWCLFEVLQTLNRLDKSNAARFEGLHFTTRSGVLNAGTAPVDTVLKIGAHVSDVYFEHARATEQKDQDLINREVQAKGGFAVLNRFVRNAVWDVVLESKGKLETSILEIGSRLRVSTVESGEELQKFGRVIGVTILGASGLREANSMTVAMPYCICRVLGNTAVKPVRTGTDCNTLAPQWNSGPFYFEARQVVGRVLEFSVVDDSCQFSESGAVEQDDLLCSASLPFDRLWPSGFSGELPLQGRSAAPGAALTVRVLEGGPGEQTARDDWPEL
ncbi:unnamed protein product [Prorocentrum cordatum]|uniref:C2 domain-containing protein n=1 Tax=Prorocentrum cordatum TaxID=2364126 RepID=A0ABN9VR04_9DINO|nr:unnamed protein product [Polarella glacialis]